MSLDLAKYMANKSKIPGATIHNSTRYLSSQLGSQQIEHHQCICSLQQSSHHVTGKKITTMNTGKYLLPWCETLKVFFFFFLFSTNAYKN